MLGNKDCKRIKELIIEWNHINIEERKAVLEHIERCQSCRLFFEEERALDSLLSKWRIEVKPKSPSLQRILIIALVTIFIFLSVFTALNLLSAPPKSQVLKEEEVWVLGPGKFKKVVLYGTLPEDVLIGVERGIIRTTYYFPIPGIFKAKGG